MVQERYGPDMVQERYGRGNSFRLNIIGSGVSDPTKLPVVPYVRGTSEAGLAAIDAWGAEAADDAPCLKNPKKGARSGRYEALALLMAENLGPKREQRKGAIVANCGGCAIKECMIRKAVHNS